MIDNIPLLKLEIHKAIKNIYEMNELEITKSNIFFEDFNKKFLKTNIEYIDPNLIIKLIKKDPLTYYKNIIIDILILEIKLIENKKINVEYLSKILSNIIIKVL